MARVLLYLLVTLGIGIKINFAVAAEMPMKIVTLKQTQQLEDQKIYSVVVKCTSLQSFSGIKKNYFGFASSVDSISHYLIFANEAPAAALPSSSIALVHVFSADGKDNVDHTTCNRTFFVKGGQPLYMTGVVTSSKTYRPSKFFSVFMAGVDLVSPLYAIFSGGVLAPEIAGKITNIKSTDNPFKKMLDALASENNRTTSKPITAGSYTVTTPYSKETIVVTEVKSIILGGNASFKRTFRTEAREVKEKLNLATLEASCAQVASALRGIGFTSSTDIAYTLYNLALGAPVTAKDKMLTCLGTEYGRAVAQLDKSYWPGVDPKLLISEADITNFFGANNSGPLQPNWEVAKSYAYKLTVALGQYGQSDLPSPSTTDIEDLMEEPIQIVDETSTRLLAVDNQPRPKSSIGEVFRSKGFRRFGCYVQTTDDTDTAIDGARVMLLGFAAEKAAKKTTIDTAITLRPMFEQGKIKVLRVSRNLAWIKSALETNKYSCNDFIVDKPTAQ